MTELDSGVTSSGMVKLRDGSIVPLSVLVATRQALEQILKENPCAVYDFVRKCQDSNYQFTLTAFGDPREILIRYDLMTVRGEIPYWIEKAILNMVDIEGGRIDFMDPRKKIKTGS